MELFGSSRSMAFTVEGFSLRMLVFTGKKIESWYSVPLNPTWIRDGQVASPGDVGRVMAETIKGKDLPSKGVVSAMPSTGSTSQVLTLPRLQKRDLDKTVAWEMKRLMPGSTDIDYIYWQAMPWKATKLQMAVFALAVPVTNVQNLVNACRAAGVTMKGMELKPFSLVRAVNCERGVIVHGEIDNVEIVVVDRSSPALFRAIPVKETAASPDSAAQIILRELPFTIDYYNRAHPESSLAPDSAVYLSGSLALEPDILSKVTKATGRTVMRVEPPPGCPENFPLEQQLVNVGLMLKTKWD
jgi:hypothetical protein